MDTYLFVYFVEDELVKKMANINEIAKTVGCRDFNETSKHMVYRVLPDAVHQLEIRDYPRDLCVELRSRYGDVLETGYYPDH